MTHSAKAHFDHIATTYDSYKEKYNPYYDAQKFSLKEFLPKKPNSVLDIGCGTGILLISTKPKKGMGIDISPEMIQLAKQKNIDSKSISFKVHDIERKTFPGEFDFILCNDVIEHFASVENAIANIAKTMNKKSILILSMANPMWEPFLMLLEKLKLKMPEGPHHRISERQFKHILLQNNLQVLTKKVYLPTIHMPILNELGLLYVYKIQKKT